MLWIVPSDALRWCSIVLALCLSGSVLVLTFWPVIQNDHPRVAIVLTLVIALLHVLLAVGCKVCFNSSHRNPDITLLNIIMTVLHFMRYIFINSLCPGFIITVVQLFDINMCCWSHRSLKGPYLTLLFKYISTQYKHKDIFFLMSFQ